MISTLISILISLFTLALAAWAVFVVGYFVAIYIKQILSAIAAIIVFAYSSSYLGQVFETTWLLAALGLGYAMGVSLLVWFGVSDVARVIYRKWSTRTSPKVHFTAVNP